MIFDGTRESLNDGDELYLDSQVRELEDEFAQAGHIADFVIEGVLDDTLVYSAAEGDPFISPSGREFAFAIFGIYNIRPYDNDLYVQFTNSEQTYDDWEDIYNEE